MKLHSNLSESFQLLVGLPDLYPGLSSSPSTTANLPVISTWISCLSGAGYCFSQLPHHALWQLLPWSFAKLE
jgi:hypothetical protein